MGIAHEEKFHFRDGSAVEDVEGLRSKLEGISYQEFYHHVNAEKNDFASWVRHVLKEPQLADDLDRVTSIVETVEILNDHVHPLPVAQPHDDLQSKIEEEALHMHIPTDTAPPAPEEPVHEPAPELPSEEVPVDAAPAEQEPPAEPEPTQEEPPAEPADLNVIQQSVDQPQTETAPAPGDHHLSKREYTRLIVKDFVVGLIFGMIIGLIIGRMLVLGT